MVNTSVQQWRPDGASASLWAEVQARYGSRAQNKGFWAGSGATTWNITSHNADNQGIAHAVDIGVDIEGDGTGLLVADADWLFNKHLRAIGRADYLAGRHGRLAYVIYNGQIFGDHTGWDNRAYTGSSPHRDHGHISTTFDYYWGDPPPQTAQWEWDSRASWGISGALIPASSITPIEEEDFLMALTPDEETAFKHATFTKAGQEERARVDADVLLSSRVPMLDGGEATVAELFATVDKRLKEIKAATDKLPSLDTDLRGEADIQRADRIAKDSALVKLTALLAEKQGLSVDDIRAGVASAIADSIRIDVTFGNTQP